ncbi:lytic transglycosylase domain-containing protein [Asticcacaulis benevestitus]|nr:lytic transglycosylase domain-containing protein [Asticcacaulis benevestitus]
MVSVVAASASDIAPFVREASRQTGVPEPVIWAVIRVESRGDVRAMSPKGAMGLMQLMPETWSTLRGILHLGQDAFDPHDNIVAGTYYLRDLYDRYGWEGVFAAYNAGPGRYKSHRDRGQILPAETRGYVIRISEELRGKTYAFAPLSNEVKPTIWAEAALFIKDTTITTDPGNGFQSPATPFVSLGAPTDIPEP